MKNLLTFLFWTFSTLIFSQNYECIKTNSISHFLGENSYIASVRIDSLSVQENYTDFMSYHMVRDGDSYLTPYGDSWIGSKYRLMTNGDSYFYNAQDDSIYIQFPDSVNQSWQVFESIANNIKIQGTISLFEEETFLGLTDSVATISFIVTDLNGNLISNPVSNYTLKLSKNYGLISILNFYTFPFVTTYFDGYGFYPSNSLSLIGITNPDIGWQNIEANNIYDWEIGWEFHSLATFTPQFGPPASYTHSSTTKTIRKVLNKITLIDSVFYTIERCKSYNAHYSQNDSNVVSKVFDTIMEKYSFDQYFNLLPYELNTNTWPTCFYVKTESTVLDKDSWYFNDLGNNNLTQFLFTGSFNNTYTFQLGKSHNSYEQFGGSDDLNFVYYQKDTLIWGTPYSCSNLLAVSENLTMNQGIELAPNPFTTSISIKFPDFSEKQIQVIDQYGKEVLSLISFSTNVSLNLEKLKPGIYFLTSELNSATQTIKIIKL